MSSLNKKIDFKVVFSVKGANPNGDPLNGNRPRQTSDGFGEVSDVALKRKIRNRLQDMGEKIFVQSADRANDGYKSLKSRLEGVEELKEVSKGKNADEEKFSKLANEQWIDVRTFGQVFAFSGGKQAGVSVGIRGPVSVQTARSISPIVTEEMQITKSVNSEDTAGKGSDTMGTKYTVDFGVYVFNGSINVQLAEKTGFTQEDATKLHEALKTLFENDESSARPAGTMEVLRVYWWEHDNKLGQHSSAQMHRSVKIMPKNDEVSSLDDVIFDESEMYTDVETDIYRG